MAMIPDGHNGMVLVRKPHYALRGDALVFMSSQRPALQLSPDEAAVWNRLVDVSGAHTPSLKGGDAIDPELRKRLMAAGAATEVESQWPVGRRRILVIEPHSDDAALSIGATMWSMRHEAEFTLVTVCSQSNYTSYFHLEREFFNVERVSSLRNAEARLFMMAVGGHHLPLGIEEATLRYERSDWTLDWFRRHRVAVSANNNHRVLDTEVEAVARALAPHVANRSYDEVWFPIGAGTHADHDMTRNACLLLMQQESGQVLPRGEKARWVAYQDVPYDSNFPRHLAELLQGLKRSGASLTAWKPDVSAVMGEKKRLLSIFASQFKVGAIEAGVDRSASAGRPDHDAVEHFWRFESLPNGLDPRDLFIDAAQVQAASRQLRASMPAFQRGRLQFIFVVPAGRWRMERNALHDAFSGARFELLAFPAAAAELGREPSNTDELLALHPGWRGWLQVLGRTMRPSTDPVIFISGVPRFRAARRLARLWAWRPTIVCESMCIFMESVRAQHPQPTR